MEAGAGGRADRDRASFSSPPSLLISPSSHQALELFGSRVDVRLDHLVQDDVAPGLGPACEREEKERTRERGSAAFFFFWRPPGRVSLVSPPPRARAPVLLLHARTRASHNAHHTHPHPAWPCRPGTGHPWRPRPWCRPGQPRRRRGRGRPRWWPAPRRRRGPAPRTPSAWRADAAMAMPAGRPGGPGGAPGRRACGREMRAEKVRG